MFCTNCGKKFSDGSKDYVNELPDGTKVCSNCGYNLKIPTQSENISTPSGQTPEPNANLNSSQNGILAHKCHSKPLSTANFFFTQILFLIPIVNIFFIIYWSFKKNINENLKSYARSVLIWTIIGAIISVFAILTLTFIRHPISFNFSLHG